MVHGSRRAIVLVSAFLLALDWQSWLWADELRLTASDGRRVEARVEVPEESPQELVLTIRIPGTRGVSLADTGIPGGVELTAQSTRPYVDESGATGSEIVLELKSSEGGTARVFGLGLAEGERRFSLSPFDLHFPEIPGRTAPPASWSWRAPIRVWRYSSFAVSLGREDGSPPTIDAWPSFQTPAGLFLEPGKGGFAWLGGALEAGRIELPAVRIMGSEAGEAPALPIVVDDLPPALSESRAVGNFTISLKAPDSGRQGEALVLDVVLRGEGNFPFLRLPEPRILLAGRKVTEESLSENRSDDYAPSGSSYRGSATLEIVFIPSGAGDLRIEGEWAFLGPGDRVFTLTMPTRQLSIAPTASGSPDGAIALALGELKAARPRGDDRLASAASAALGRGEGGAALALVFHAARFDARYRPLAASLAARLGAPAPDLGPLIGPWPWLLAAAILTAAAIAAALVARRRVASRGGVAALILCGLFALAALSGGVSVAVDRGRTRWLSWSTTLSSAPSTLSERRAALSPGLTGRLIGSVEGWVCLEFPDGAVGWLQRSSVYSY